MRDELKTALLAGTFVFAVGAFTLGLRTKTQPAAPTTITVEAVPVVDPEEAAKKAEEERRRKMLEMEKQQVEIKRRFANEALQKFKNDHGGKLPEQITLNTPLMVPGAWGTDKMERLKSTPVHVDLKKGELSFDGCWVRGVAEVDPQAEKRRVATGIVEMLIARPPLPNSKAHETMIQTEVNPYDVWLGLLLLGLKPGSSTGREGVPEGDSVDIILQFVDDKGRTHSHHAEEFIFNTTKGRPLDRMGWIFTAAWVYKDRKTGEWVQGVRECGAVATVFHFPFGVLLDTPGRMFDIDDDFVYNNNLLPTLGSHARVVMRRHVEDEREKGDERNR